jgi:hypothetical protein
MSGGMPPLLRVCSWCRQEHLYVFEFVLNYLLIWELFFINTFRLILNKYSIVMRGWYASCERVVYLIIRRFFMWKYF